MEFAELGRDTVLAFKIFIRQTSEDRCKRRVSVVPHSSQALNQTLHPCSLPNLESDFNDATGHVPAPLGGLAWLCVGLSCKKKTCPCFDRSWPSLAKVQVVCLCITFPPSDLLPEPQAQISH